jgi:hypothetical protein
MLKNDIGFYSVGNRHFSSKLEAVLAAQLSNEDVEWNFFDEVFKRTDWTQEPTATLDDFYKSRAQQIREQYDYVIVFCSGGADSTNVIKSFINNGIAVDEVIGIAPMSGIKNWNYDPNNVSDLNIISETKFALLPLLDELTTQHNIKCTLYDFFEDMLNYSDEEWTFDSCGNIVTALTSHFTKVDALPHINKLIQAGKKIALVYGTDKPIIKVAPNGDMNFILSDAGVNYLNMPDHRRFPNVDRVLFYWTPDLPEMLVKQAHVVARVVQRPEFEQIFAYDVLSPATSNNHITYQQVLDHQQSHGQKFYRKEDLIKHYISRKTTDSTLEKYSSYRTIYQRAIVPYIYPSTYTKNLWQAQKIEITEGFFTRDQDWVHVLHQGSRVSQVLNAGTKMLYDSIHPRFLNYTGTGFRMLNKMYKIGTIGNLPKEKI